MTDQPDITIGVKAACQWANEELRQQGVRIRAGIVCGYPMCSCKVLPGQIRAALKATHEAEMARWRAEFDRTREPTLTAAEHEAVDRHMMPHMLRKAADQAEKDEDERLRQSKMVAREMFRSSTPDPVEDGGPAPETMGA